VKIIHIAAALVRALPQRWGSDEDIGDKTSRAIPNGLSRFLMRLIFI
jgi:hypothetical protein